MTHHSRRQMKRRTGQAGFTLVEVLVASFLMAIIVGALGTVTAQWMPNWNRGFARLQRTDQLVAGIERLVSDVSAAEPVSTGEGKGLPFFDGGELSVTFVRTALGPNATSTLELVRIAEIGTDKGASIVRSTAPFLPFNAEVQAPEPNFTKPVVVVRPPHRVSFAYAGPDGEWQPTWKDANALPQTIRINVREGASSRAFISTVATVATVLPAMCVNAKSPNECPALGGTSTPGSTNAAQAQPGTMPQPGTGAGPGRGGVPMPTGGGGGIPMPGRR